jgi:hypothetical protein
VRALRKLDEKLALSDNRIGREETAGILSLAHLAAHVFELRAVRPPLARPGDTIRILVTTVHPVSGLPVAGVALEATLDLDSPPPIKIHAVSNKDGLASFEFQPPEKHGQDSLDFEISGQLGDFRQTADLSMDVARNVDIYIQTDKPIYQPGQVLPFGCSASIRLIALPPTWR